MTYAELLACFLDLRLERSGAPTLKPLLTAAASGCYRDP